MTAIPSGRGQTASEPGGNPVGRRAHLPKGAREPIRVFINGVVQECGGDYEISGEEIVFQQPIWKEAKPGRLRFAGLMLAGRYQKHEIVDVEYTVDGRTELISDVEIQPES